MWLLYNVLLTILAPFWVPWMLWRVHRRGEKPNWRERQGDYRESIPKKGERPRLWVHAVSVGEVVAVRPLLRALRKELPEHELVLSITTSSGHQTAREGSAGLYDHLVYLPIDVPRFTLSAMQRVRPDALIVMETELWMNLFWAAKAFEAKTFVVNARLSDRSFPRARRLAFFYRALLGMVDHVLAQSETDAKRFRELGASKVEATGNVKFDQALEGLDDKTDWRQELGLDDRPVVVVGSVRAEEFPDLAGIPTIFPMTQWVIAPRHIEMADELFERLEEEPIVHVIVRRSRAERGSVIVLDTYGELSRVYSIAEVAIVGGSFRELGGQNIIQPLAWGKPVLYGPHMANFRDVAALAERAGASLVCDDANDLVRKLHALLEDQPRRGHMGAAARRLVYENRGASERVATKIASNLRA